MTEVQIPDAGGDTFTVYDHDGCYFPKFDTRAIKGLQSVKIRDDDVLLLGYPKSGNHWLWEVLRQILAGRTFHDDVIMAAMFMECTPEVSYAQIPSPRVLTSHGQLHQLSPDVIKKKPKIVNLLRNPKDSVVSFYTFGLKLQLFEYSGKWENFLKTFTEKFVYHTWMEHVLSWEKVKDDYPDWPILTVYYEDLIEDPIREFRKLSTFLGVERSDDFLKEVYETCKFEEMKKNKSTTARKQLYFRKGQVGDWKNWFTVAQNEWFDQYLHERLKDTKLKFRYTLD